MKIFKKEKANIDIMKKICLLQWKRDPEMEKFVRERRGRGTKRKRCAMYVYQLHTMNVILLYSRHILIKSQENIKNSFAMITVTFCLCSFAYKILYINIKCACIWVKIMLCYFLFDLERSWQFSYQKGYPHIMKVKKYCSGAIVHAPNRKTVGY